MTRLKLLPAGLIAVAMLATPAIAREGHVTSRHLAADSYAADSDASTTPGARYIDGRICYPAPRVGSFAGQPWDNDTPCYPYPASAY
jgi:hypothetical protein